MSKYRSSNAVVFVVVLGLASQAVAQTLPTGYDLRSVTTESGVSAWVPAIQNQGAGEDCWTFATATAINSNLQMSGFLPTSSIAPKIQISSWHLSTRNGAPDQVIASEALGNNSNWGADSMGQALGYLTRGQGQWDIPNVPNDPDTGLPSSHYIGQMGGGVVLDSAAVSPSNAFPVTIEHSSGYPSDLTSLLPPASQTPAFRVTSVISFDQGFGTNVALPTPSGTADIQGTTYNLYNFTQGAADPQVQVVKQAILGYGAVTTWMNADESDFSAVANPVGSQYQSTLNYVNNRTAVGYSDHSVTIIGWDDTYQITQGGKTYTGAWLVQNSWGHGEVVTGSGSYDGTFWAPYDDAVIGRSGVNAFKAVPQGGVKVLQNELGPMDYSDNYTASYGTNPSGAANPLLMATSDASQFASVLTSDQDGFLTAVGVATQLSDVLLKLSLYGMWSEDGPEDLLFSQDFQLNSGIGYYELGLAEQIALLAGDDIILQLVYIDEATGLPMSDAVAVTVGGSGLNGYRDVTEGLSYYFDEATSSWVDFNTVTYAGGSPSDDAHGGILFAKGIVSVPEPSTFALCGIALGGLVVMLRRRPLRV